MEWTTGCKQEGVPTHPCGRECGSVIFDAQDFFRWLCRELSRLLRRKIVFVAVIVAAPHEHQRPSNAE